LKPNLVSRGADRYAAGEIERFDQKNNMFFRAILEPGLSELAKQFYGVAYPQDKPGYRLEDMALEQAGWYAEEAFGMGNLGGKEGFYSWESPKIWYSDFRPPTDLRFEVNDPAAASRMIKKAAGFYGASLVGICALNRCWLYASSMRVRGKNIETLPVDVPEDCNYAIVLAHEMKYDLVKLLPSRTGAGGVTNAYGRMAFTAGTLAQFIRYLGYKAIPMGNDTANSIPLAIDAGLGELSRAGLLITPEYGPRVRLNKIFTNMPLAVDSPVEFGVWEFCMQCEKCAHLCPGQAIMYGAPTDEPNNISNRGGLLRWPLNAEKCFAQFAKTVGMCGVCIRVCPFNKEPGLLHDAVRLGIKNAHWLDPLFVKVDDMLGYGRKGKVAQFWEGQ